MDVGRNHEIITNPDSGKEQFQQLQDKGTCSGRDVSLSKDDGIPSSHTIQHVAATQLTDPPQTPSFSAVFEKHTHIKDRTNEKQSDGLLNKIDSARENAGLSTDSSQESESSLDDTSVSSRERTISSVSTDDEQEVDSERSQGPILEKEQIKALEKYSLTLVDGKLYRGTEEVKGLSPQTLFQAARVSLVKAQVFGDIVLTQDKIFQMKAKPLGEGGYGQVFEAKEVGVKEDSVIVKRSSEDIQAVTDAENEYELLTDIHEGGEKTVVGIQAPPHMLVDFGSGRTGYLAPKYDRDIREDADTPVQLFIGYPPVMSLENRLDCAHQVLDGLSHVHGKDIRHGDIKEDNFLLKELPNQKFELVISDWGGARKLKMGDVFDEREIKNFGVHTDEFVNPKDEIAFAGLTDNPKRLKLFKARDVFAMGMVLRDTILVDRDGLTPKQNEMLGALISKMLDSDYITRIEAKDALKELGLIMSQGS